MILLMHGTDNTNVTQSADAHRVNLTLRDDVDHAIEVMAAEGKTTKGQYITDHLMADPAFVACLERLSGTRKG